MTGTPVSTPRDRRPLLTLERAAETLGLPPTLHSRRVVSSMVKNGRLRAVTIGKRLMVDPNSLDRIYDGTG